MPSFPCLFPSFKLYIDDSRVFSRVLIASKKIYNVDTYARTWKKKEDVLVYIKL